jgi:hypothetical protein
MSSYLKLSHFSTSLRFAGYFSHLALPRLYCGDDFVRFVRCADGFLVLLLEKSMTTRGTKKMSDANSNLRITVTLRRASKPSSVKAHADVRVEFSSSSLEIFGCSIVEHDPAKPAWVSYPQRPGKDSKKYYSIVRLTGTLHEKVCAAVLEQWERDRASAASNGGVPRAQIPREPGDEAPF